jgi:hypothetical protein
MHDTWMRIGRFWTNGEHFLAVDSALRSAWRGYGNDDYEKLILTLSGETGGVPVGAGRAALVGDGTVRDDSWIEAFQTRTGLVAFVQADGPDYPSALASALGYPTSGDQDCGELVASSGQLSVFSAGFDGSGPYSCSWAEARPGPAPAVHGGPFRGSSTGLLISASRTRYVIKVRWHTELGEDHFARWLLIPGQQDD